MKKRPTILITMGDPTGIGPEIAVKALTSDEIYELCKPIIIGDLRVLEAIVMHLKIVLKCEPITTPRLAKGVKGVIDVIDLKNIDQEKLVIGVISADAGKASLEYLNQAVDYALRKDVDAIVTAPINKKAINLARSKFIGHTEFLAALTHSKEPLTMFWVKGARIFFLSRHLPIKNALKMVNKQRIVNFTLKIDRLLKKLGIKEPRIALAAVNPHAGDSELLGAEEAKEISPAVKELGQMGITAHGPIAADSVFHQTFEGKYDAVLAMYHDQGHIAAKTLDFYGTVSATFGLPFTRTSVDHGTAHDIAGTGIANPKSLVKAIKLAVKLVNTIQVPKK